MTYIKMIDGEPNELGWCGTTHGWDLEHEGAFGGTHYWDGARWLQDKDGAPAVLPIFRFTEQRFALLSKAEAFADANDLGW